MQRNKEVHKTGVKEAIHRGNPALLNIWQDAHGDDIYSFHQLMFSGSMYEGENPVGKAYARAEETRRPRGKIYFPNLQYHKTGKEGSETIYIALPKTFINLVERAGREGIKVYQKDLVLKWSLGFDLVDTIPGTEYHAPDNSTFVSVPQAPGCRGYYADMMPGSTGVFKGFLTFVVIAHKKVGGGEVPELDERRGFTLQVGDLFPMERHHAIMYIENSPSHASEGFLNSTYIRFSVTTIRTSKNVSS